MVGKLFTLGIIYWFIKLEVIVIMKLQVIVVMKLQVIVVGVYIARKNTLNPYLYS